MDTTARRSSGRDLGRRLLRGTAVVAVTATVGMGLTAGPASAKPNDACATARAIFRAHMNEARFFLNAADQLAAGGNHDSANLASAEADHFLSLAEGALGEMESACA
jgi:hypothetical protein